MSTRNAYQKKHLTTNATTVLSPGPCTLHTVVINTKGGSSNTLTLYDNATAASGTVGAIIDTTANVGSLRYDTIYPIGLTAIMGTGTAADVTITWGS